MKCFYKILCCHVILLGLSFNASSQNQFYHSSPDNYRGMMVKKYPSGDILQAIYNNWPYKVALLKTDSNGVVLMNKILMDSSFIEKKLFGIEVASDGGFYLFMQDFAVANKMITIKGDSSGNIQWTRYHYAIRNVYVNCVEKLASGNFLFGGNIRDQADTSDNLYLLAIDTLGNPIWSNEILIPGDPDARIEHCTALPDSGFVIQKYTNFPPWNYLIRYSGSGNIVYTQDYSYTSNNWFVKPGNFMVTPSGRNFLAANMDSSGYNQHSVLMELDSLGNVINYVSFLDAGPTQLINPYAIWLFETASGDIKVFTNASWIWNTLYGKVYPTYIRFTSQLNLVSVSSTTVPFNDQLAIQDMLMVSDDMFVQSLLKEEISIYFGLRKYNPENAACISEYAQSAYTYPVNLPAPVTLLVTENFLPASDSIGQLTFTNDPLPLTSCFSVGLQDEVRTEIKIYPNPFSTETFIAVAGLQGENLRIYLSDTQGRIYTAGFETEITREGIQLRNKTLSPGCYFMVIQESEHIRRIKLIIV